MPAQDGVRSTKAYDTREEPTTEGFAFLGQSSALIVVESDAALSEGFAEDGIFCAKVVDDLLQFAVGVAGENTGKQVPGFQDELHCRGILQRG